MPPKPIGSAAQSDSLSATDLNSYIDFVHRPSLVHRREPGDFATWAQQAHSHVNIRVGEWPNTTSEERAWYETRLQTDRLIWEAAGIAEAIVLSFSLPTSTDKALIAVAACLLNSATNTFYFPLGQMSISLLDVLAITGLPIHMKPYMSGDFATTELTYTYNLGARRALKALFPV
ncbi:hypothetical protein ACLB2K_040155 [Fragaria x ananassa]